MKKIANQACLSNSFKDKLLDIMKEIKLDRMGLVMESTKKMETKQYLQILIELD